MPRPIRPPAKPCASHGCKFPAGPGLRYCGVHGSQILARLRESAEWRAGDEAKRERNPSEL